MSEAPDGREGRYRRQAHRVSAERDWYRRTAIVAVAVLLLRCSDDFGLLADEDPVLERNRAVELSAMMADRWR
ncbi:hypothetical protein [Streptomyces sp. SID13031]|uniref:hypothetical protein n=1 Tax=Streptomyces sp. SID13031 TaxID=2706046 RepID=UPI0013C8DF20|nr:hypothetical protein [Streptomyces sp. SID13031]NEA37300.1 hypothetical protein [Streptomyces sp. SID13031]